MRMFSLMHGVFSFFLPNPCPLLPVPPPDNAPIWWLYAANRNSYTFGQSYSGYRSLYGSRLSNLVPSYQQRQQQQRESQVNSDDKPSTTELTRFRERSSVGGVTSLTSSAAFSPNHATATTITSTSTTNSVIRRCVFLMYYFTTFFSFFFRLVFNENHLWASRKTP